MALLRVLLVSSAILVLVQSFPSTSKNGEDEQHINLQANKTIDPNLQHVPSTMLNENKDSENGAELIEFVYNSPEKNQKVEKGTDRDKYRISDKLNEKTKNSRTILEHETLKPFKDSTTVMDSVDNITGNETDIKTDPSDTLKSKDGTLEETYIIQHQWSLTPKEVSSTMGGLPKYVYDFLEPVLPFPEMNGEAKQFGDINLESDSDFRLPLISAKDNQPPQTAGPMLYPQSIYSRAFDISIFD